jgi:hypothetical protein
MEAARKNWFKFDSETKIGDVSLEIDGGDTSTLCLSSLSLLNVHV